MFCFMARSRGWPILCVLWIHRYVRRQSFNCCMAHSLRHCAITRSLLGQNDVVTPIWRNNDIMASRARYDCVALVRVKTGSTLYSKGSFVRRFFSPKPFEVAMVRRTYGPKVLYSEVPLLRKLLCPEDYIFRKDLHCMDSMLRRFFSPKFI